MKNLKKLNRNSMRSIKGAVKMAGGCPDPGTAIGPCINGFCPPDHFCCDNQCYPVTH